MQASKIVIGKLYAVKAGGGTLLRFRPKEVITTRNSNTGSPHDYSSVVKGWLESIVPDQPNQLVEINPKQIEGEFEQFSELVARQKAEQERKDQEHKKVRDTTCELAALLYNLTGLDVPEDLSVHRAPFRITGYRDDTIDINFEGIEALLAYLKSQG